MNFSTLDLEAAQHYAGNIKIPPAPEILTKLNREMQKTDSSIQVIAKLIEKDAGIAGLILKTVNSSLFGLRNKISSIPHAISLLGLNYTVNIIKGIVLKQAFDKPAQNPPRFWESPSNIALVAANLCSQLLSCSVDEAYLLGLFHNAGHSLINQRYPDYLDFLQKNQNHPETSIAQLENEHYRFDHALLGYFLSTSWDIPEHLQHIILDHHNAEKILDSGSYREQKDCQKGLLAILKMAEHIDNLFAGLNPDYEWQRINQAVLGYLAMSEEDFTDLRMDILEKLEIDLN